MMKKTKLSLSVLLGAIVLASHLRAVEVSTNHPAPWRMPSIFSENMVLQRDVPVPIWGWGPEGQSLTVQFGTNKLVTTVTNGRWRVTLPPTPAGGPHSLILIPKDETQIQLFSQVLFGDVWLICGQSNMQTGLSNIDPAEREEAVRRREEFPLIRVAQVCHRNPHLTTEIREEPVSYWGNVKWESTTFLAPRSNTADIPGCGSAVSYFFARALQQKLGTNVPIGMVEVGAIMSGESWISYDEVAATPELAHLRGKLYPNATSRCYGANIAPLVPLALRGFVYYQGEMNAGRGEEYRDVLPALIRSWRKAWQNEDLPFLIVQLPGFTKNKPRERVALDMPDEILKQLQKDSLEHGFIGIREAQLMTRLNVPRTGLAVILDLGDPYDIHPGRKRVVGERLALLARQLSYGEKELVAEGPLATDATFSGDSVRVKFLNVGGGLVAPSGKMTSFELAGEDGKWVEAEAKVDGGTVVVSAPGLAAPKAVRYAWAGYPQFSLFNNEGIPASPFRFPIPVKDKTAGAKK